MQVSSQRKNSYEIYGQMIWIINSKIQIAYFIGSEHRKCRSILRRDLKKSHLKKGYVSQVNRVT